MTELQAIVLAVVQGITELFPISSLGHAVLLPALLNWPVDENADGFLPFLVVMHLGTAIALLLYFWRSWWRFGASILFPKDAAAAAERQLFYRVIVATIPAVIIGYFLEHLLRRGFGAPLVAAFFLIVNGIMLFAAERWKGRTGHAARPLKALRRRDALAIGIWQCLALIPGISRSGATMAGGYLAGLNHEDSARFSFLTATPIILGAAVLEGPKLLKQGGTFSDTALIAGVVAGVTAFASVAILMRWFRRHEFRAFDPFAAYCGIAGIAALVVLAAR